MLTGLPAMVMVLLDIPHERDEERVLSVLEFERELTFLIRNSSGDEVVTLFGTDVGKVNRLFGTGVNHFTGQLCREGADGESQKHQYINNLFHPCLFC